MASSAGRVPTEAPTAYAAAKAGVVMLSRQVTNEVGEHGVRVIPFTLYTPCYYAASGHQW
jgi:NAD(P)-dependent dehydrogenase (short-subunit alcohol dehydrogenase family)